MNTKAFIFYLKTSVLFLRTKIIASSSENITNINLRSSWKISLIKILKNLGPSRDPFNFNKLIYFRHKAFYEFWRLIAHQIILKPKIHIEIYLLSRKHQQMEFRLECFTNPTPFFEKRKKNINFNQKKISELM